MPDYEISQDVLDQARDAAAPARDAVESPTTAEPLNQPVPDVPADMSNVPDPYDVAGQEAYRADQRAEAVEFRDVEPEAAPEQVAEPEAVSIEEGVNNMSPEDMDAMLEAGMTLRENARTREALTPSAATAPEAATPEQDVSLEPTVPEPQGPNLDKD